MKPAFRPGSNLWLLAHELRLQARSVMTNKAAQNWTIGSVSLLVAIGAIVSIPLALAMRGFVLALPPLAAMAVLGASLLFLTMMLSQTVAAGCQSLFERSDFDLLFSSPLHPSAVLLVRCVGIASAALFWPLCLLGVPVAVFGVIVDWQWLGIYLAMLSLALVSTVIGMSVAIVLSQWIGPIKTRAAARVLSAILGVGIGVGIQLINYSDSLRTPAMEVLIGWSQSDLFKDGHALNLLAMALLGRGWWLLALAMVSFGGFVAMVVQWGPAFADRAAMANGMRAKPDKAKAVERYKFTINPTTTLVRKEMRLLRRKPDLLIQSLIQSTSILPAIIIPIMALDDARSYFVTGGASWLVILASTMASSLAWLILSAEDSPDLIGTAPVASEAIIRAKTMATLLPVVALIIPPLVYVAWLSPWTGATCLVGAICAAYGSAQIAIWHRKPAPRKSWGGRQQVSVAVGLSGIGLAFSCAGASFLAAIGSWAWLIPAFIAFGIMVIMRPDKPAATVY
jgi:ABC-2 type transport system permease protein